MPDTEAVKFQPLLLGAMAFAVLLAVTAVAMMGPLLIDMAAALEVTVPLAGQLVTAASIAWAATALVVGPFSDTHGRKPVLLLGLCLLTAGTLGIGVAPNFALAMNFSILVGIGSGMVPPTCIALVGDAFPEARKPMSIAVITMQPGMSSVVGVPLAAVLADWAGWRMAFYVLGLTLPVAALCLLALAPGRATAKPPLDLARRLRQVAVFPVTWQMAATNVLARITWGVIVTFFPAYLILNYELGTVEVALPVAVVALWTAAAPLLGGRIGRLRPRLDITAALLFTAVIPGLGVFLFDWGLWNAVWIASAFMFLIVPVTTMLMILVAETAGAARGTMAGVISCSNWSGTALGAAIGGVLVAQFGYGALSFLLAGAILGSGLLMWLCVTDRAMVRARRHFAAPKAGETP